MRLGCDENLENSMKIKSLDIVNFRGIREVAMRELGTMVVIAGQNGSGKSCIFDAIRLLKSVYGGYQANEWHQWMGEFQINLGGPASNFLSIFNERDRELRIGATFSFHDDERTYIRENAEELLRELVLKSKFPDAYGWGGAFLSFHQLQLREREDEIAAAIREKHGHLLRELERDGVAGELSIRPGEHPQIQDSVCLSLAFSSFRPQHLGLIDFHGAQRHYGRENVQGVNLNLDSSEAQRSHHALYNYANKYTNVKGEMAAAYVREILAEQAGVARANQVTLTNTLRELFETFFPEKAFRGPVPNVDGSLKFPVMTPGGGSHDLDDLSSGEKEILYGYLRIRNSAPKHSIILLDEPELHLNPRLIRGLPQFYKKKLGEELGNQIWLVTHSDALLREVVGRESYNVFHMTSHGSVQQGDSQLKPMTAGNDLEMALADLVGDLDLPGDFRSI
jgi:predicted ATPase